MPIRSLLALVTVALGATGCARVSVHEPPPDGEVAEADPAVDAGEDGGAEDAATSPADAAPGSGSCAWQRAPSDWPTFGQHTATLLHDGRVLVVGSTTVCAANVCTTASAALFQPTTDAWT